jgi:hypothetical protein
MIETSLIDHLTVPLTGRAQGELDHSSRAVIGHGVRAPTLFDRLPPGALSGSSFVACRSVSPAPV